MELARPPRGRRGATINPARELAAFRDPAAFLRAPIALLLHSRLEWRREVTLRIALALLPCAVLVLHLREVLGSSASSWVVPLAMTAVNALLVISLAREVLRGRGFLVFWALYSLLWIAAAWHGVHFHSAPRPAALFMNLDEIAQTPLPDWSEIPWGILAAALALGWLARTPSPRGRDLRLTTLAAAMAFGALHTIGLFRYQTADMLRFSSYDDLVRTQGLEGAAILDGVDLLREPDGAEVFRQLRIDAAERPAAPLPLDPVGVDRVVIVQIESLDRDALTPEVAPNLLRLWNGATHGLVNTMHSSVSGSSGADFQLLTGLRPLTRTPPYRLTWDEDGSGLPAYAASKGFAFHAYHGNNRHFWNRGPFFAALGVDFHSGELLEQTEFSRWGKADGDLFRYAAASIREQRRAVHFLITLSSHAPYDLVDPAAHQQSAPVLTRYLESISYVDAALGDFLQQLPSDGRSLVALYGDHTSGLFDAAADRPVPLILGMVAGDRSLAPLASGGSEVHELAGVLELAALNRYVKDSLDASAR